MAAFPSTPKDPQHARSISLPSRSHPATLEVEEQLQRLRASEATPSSSSISHNLSGLKDLYDRVDELLQLPLTQQILSCERHVKCIDEVLNGSLRLLDVGSIARDVLSQMREYVQDLQSACRRRRCEELDKTNEFNRYIIFRKKMIMEIRKCVADMRRTEKKRSFSGLLDRDINLPAMVHVLNQVEEITLGMFESLLSFISRPKAQSKPSGLSLVSKLMKKNHVACKGMRENNSEQEKVDVALTAFIGHESHKGIEVVGMQSMRMELEKITLSIRDLEEGLECVFRCLVKTRVSLLNILNH